MRTFASRQMVLPLTVVFMAFMIVAVQPTTTSAEGHDGDSHEHSDQDDHSHDDEEHEDAAGSSSDKATGSTSYTAAPCQSLTEIVRMDINARNLDLTAEQRVAAETWATQDHGSRLLAEGERVSVDTAVIDAAVARAQNLSVEHQAAWSVYAARVDDFEAVRTVADESSDDDVDATDLSANQDSAADDEQSEVAESDTESESDDESDDGDDPEQNEDSDDNDGDTIESSTNGRWPWLLAGVAAVGSWFYLRRQEEK